jgi:hypothetical protein
MKQAFDFEVPKARRWPGFTALFWAALLFSFVMAALPKPPEFIETGDKVKHLLAFTTLTVLGLIVWRREYVRIALWLGFYGAFIEVVQAIPSLHRDSDIRDWWTDMLAIGISIGITWLLDRRRKPSVRG